MPRKVIFQTPRPISDTTVLVGAEPELARFFDDRHEIALEGGRIMEPIPFAGLLPNDRKIMDDYMALVFRQLETGEAKARAAALNLIVSGNPNIS